MKHIGTQVLHSVVIFASIFCSAARATDVPISNTPLVVAGRADPNLMLLFDTSGSMRQIVPEAPYDSSVTYLAACPSEWTHNIRVYVDASKKAYISKNTGSSGTAQAWSPTVGPCFHAASTYNAFLQHLTSVPGGAGSTTYSGNYLNWYFSNASHTGQATDFSDGDKKDGTRDRLEIAKASSATLVGGLNNIRVGLSSFAYTGASCGNCDSKGKIQHGLKSINTSGYRATLQSTLAGLAIDGNTPLSGAFGTIGRYFVEGFQTESLQKGSNAHSTFPAFITASTLFDEEPLYANAGDKPTSSAPAIEYSCQKNFLVTLTDGEPSQDSLYSDELG
jgi:type IV pilus assembly protein PilY1